MLATIDICKEMENNQYTCPMFELRLEEFILVNTPQVLFAIRLSLLCSLLDIKPTYNKKKISLRALTWSAYIWSPMLPENYIITRNSHICCCLLTSVVCMWHVFDVNMLMKLSALQCRKGLPTFCPYLYFIWTNWGRLT